jgi:hypothetical protein
MQLVALATGALRIDAVRVIDLHTNELVDIIDLPPVICRQ